MESGTPGVKATPDGWLNRALQAEDLRRPANHTAFRAVALGSQVPRTLDGKIPAVAVNRLQDFAVAGKNPNAAPISSAFEAMYADSVDTVLHGTGQETFEAVKMLKATDPAHYKPAPGANYPNGAFGDNMKQIAQLLKANLGVEAAFTDIGGWDTHQNQGSVNGQLANCLRDFSQGISAFWTDMGNDAENVVLVTMSEFGRTAQQNGTGGTDHGHANVMFVLGGSVKGGKVYGKWPGMATEQLYQNRDLAITTDFRQVLGEAAYKTLGARNLELVFPGSELKTTQFLNLYRADREVSRKGSVPQQVRSLPNRHVRCVRWGSRDCRTLRPYRPNRSRGACDDAGGFRGWRLWIPLSDTANVSHAARASRPSHLGASRACPCPTKSSSPIQPQPVKTSISEMANNASGRAKELGPIRPPWR